ncbi:MAG: hypothetical protein ACOY15_04305 [Pseudomonadota bacterium]
MSGRASQRRGWCPSVLRPMESGDGLIVRVQPHEQRITAPQMRALAHAAAQFGNGIIELTRRANLQIRGVTAGSLAHLQEALRETGLFDEDAASPPCDVIKSPIAAIDPQKLRAAIGLTITQTGRWFGIGIPFGVGFTSQWQGLAGLAERFGKDEIRLTPWRIVVLPLFAARDAQALAAEAQALHFITEPQDTRLSLVACTGAPACASAMGRTREIAFTLAAEAPTLFDGATVLHVSGCAKSCAHTGSATITLVADKDGYRLGLNASAVEMEYTRPLPLNMIITYLRTLAARFAREAQPNESAAAFLSRIKPALPGAIENV